MPAERQCRELRLIGATDASGDLTVNATEAIFGRLESIEWIDGDLDNGVNAVISLQSTPSGVAQTLLTLTNPAADNDAIFLPRVVVHDLSGAALTGTSGGDREMPIVAGIPRLVITSGGDTKTGGCILRYYVEK